MSGAAAQARRRSEGTNGNAHANQEETAVNDDGWCVSLEVTEDEMINCLRSHSCCGGMESKKLLLRKFIEMRAQLLARLKTH
jgi:hypothetical protein